MSRKRVARLMKKQKPQARKRRRSVRTTDSNHSSPVAPNVLERDVSSDKPNSTWATDITYVWTGEGWLYLAVVLDLFSRRVVGWSMSEHIDTKLVLGALEMALEGRQPPQGLIHHSDRGASTPAPSIGRLWPPAASSAACPGRAIAGTTPWWRASSAA